MVDLGNNKVRIDLDVDEEITCTFTNMLLGSITITKSAIPADGTDFGFTGDLGAFTLDDAAPVDDGDGFGHSLTFDLLPGVYQVSEVVPDGWTLDHITCTTQDDSDATIVDLPGVSIDLDQGEHIVCSFVNVTPLARVGGATSFLVGGGSSVVDWAIIGGGLAAGIAILMGGGWYARRRELRS